MKDRPSFLLGISILHRTDNKYFILFYFFIHCCMISRNSAALEQSFVYTNQEACFAVGTIFSYNM